MPPRLATHPGLTPIAGAVPAPARWRTELKVVLAACQPDAAEAARAVSEVLRAAEPDWEEVVRLATLHGLAPLVHRALREAGAGGVSPAARDRLERYARANSLRSLALVVELGRVLPALRAAGVLAVPFKGPVLALAAYQDVSLRQSSDLDLLIRFKDLGTARSTLATLGYEPVFKLSPNQQRAVVRHLGEMPFAHAADSIDVHWRLVGHHFPLGYDLRAMEPRLAAVTIGKLATIAPSVEDHLLILAVNANKDQWERLDRIAAIARLAVVYELDWTYVLATARHWGIRRMVLVALELATVLFGFRPGAQIGGALAADPAVARLAAAAIERLDHPSVGRRKGPGPQRRFLATWERRRDRAAYLARLLLVPTIAEAEMVELPRWLGFMYYPLRLGRVSLMAARSLLPGSAN